MSIQHRARAGLSCLGAFFIKKGCFSIDKGAQSCYKYIAALAAFFERLSAIGGGVLKRSIDSLIEELGWLNPCVELTKELVMDAVHNCGLEEPYLRHLQDNYALDGHPQMSAAKIGAAEGISRNAAATRVHKAVKAVSRCIYWRTVEAEAGKSGTPIPFPQLSVRATNCLAKANIITMEALIQKSAPELLLIRNMGRKCIVEIRKMLAENKLKLKGD